MSENYVRFRFPAQYEKLVGQLIIKKDSTQGIFDTYVEIMVFAASIGCLMEKRMPVEKPANKPDPVREQLFMNSSGGLSHVPSLLAFYDADSVDIFDGTTASIETRVEVVEEYICGGLSVIDERLKGRVDQGPIRSLASLIKSVIDSDGMPEEDFALPSIDILEVLTGK